jgi:hypothetical protein
MHQQSAHQCFQRGKATQTLHRATRSAQLFPARRKHRTKDLPVLQLSHVERLDQPRKIVNPYLSAYAVPPPLFCTQIPCFLELKDRVALQNRQNKRVVCKIVQDKELREISASFGRFRLEGGAKR